MKTTIEKLVDNHMNWASNLARFHCRRGHEFEDALSDAQVGLFQAARRFDPEHGSAMFSTFAYSSIVGSIKRGFTKRSKVKETPVAFAERSMDDTWTTVEPVDYRNNETDHPIDSEIIDQIKHNLDDREFEIVYKTVIMNEPDETLATEFAVTKQRISQIRAAAFRLLATNQALKDNLLMSIAEKKSRPS